MLIISLTLLRKFFPSVVNRRIVKNSEEEIILTEQNEAGAVIRQSCKADGYFEYCTWKSERFQCNFEWKKSHDAVKKITCHPRDFSNRVR